jgi:hypothetical protein
MDDNNNNNVSQHTRVSPRHSIIHSGSLACRGADRWAWHGFAQTGSAIGWDGGREGTELATEWMDGFMYVPNHKMKSET